MAEAGLWQRLRRKAGLAVPGLVALLLVALLQYVGFKPVDQIGLLLFDSYQRVAPRPYQDAGVRIVDIDDETIRRLGQWPWPRTDVAALTDKLANAGAAAVAFDIVFAEPDRTSPARIAERVKRDGGDADLLAALGKLPDNDAALAETLRATPSVLAFFLTHDGQGEAVEPKAGFGIVGSQPKAGNVAFSGAIQPLPVLRDAAPGLGFVSLVPDSDGIIRKAPLILTFRDRLLPTLSLEAFRVAMQSESIKIKSTDASGEGGGDGGDVVSLQVGDAVVPTTPEGQLWMYYTAPTDVRTVPAWRILTGAMSDEEMRAKFEGQVVFIGTGAQGLRDVVATPVQDRSLGVTVHAQALEQMITKSFLTRPDWALGLERTLLLALGILMVVTLPFLGALRGAILGGIAVIAMVAGSWFAFRQLQFLLDPTWPVLGLVGAYLVESGYTYWREEKQRAYIHRAFDRYLSPELVRRIVDDPSRLELGGEEREMTVLFADIRAFSRISEKLSPQQVIRFLIAFLTPMCTVLLDRRATIDKFIGDAILAFWNAPLDDPDQYGNAARGALAMVRKLEMLNRTMPGGSEPWPGEVKIGIGLNSGPCCVGNMGSAQRLSYSLIGDTVNVASRIEGLTKYYGVTIALGEDLEPHLREFAVVKLDRVRVVGRDAPEGVFALLGDEAVAGTEAFQAFAAGHAAMLLAYRAQAWDEVDGLLAAHDAAAAGFGLGKLYSLYRERVGRYRVSAPGEAWDGVYEATEK
jgi:adenylate cyclase